MCVLQESTSKYSGQTLWPPQHKGLNHTNRLIGGGMMEGGWKKLKHLNFNEDGVC